MIDVIITCYNDCKLLSDAINSVLRQTAFAQIESIIIIDDGSTDNTSELISTFNNEKIHYIYQENAGIANARNTAFTYSKAPYISFLDSDDIWIDNKIEKQLEVINTNNRIDLLYTNVFAFYGDWPSTRYEKFRSISYFGNGNLDKYFENDAPIFPSTMIISRGMFLKMKGFNETYRKSEDTELCLRILAEGYVFHIDQYLVYRRLSPSSLGADLEDLLPYQKRIEENIVKQYPHLSSILDKRHSGQYFMAAKEKLTKFGQISKARTFLKYHLQMNPKNLEAWGLLIFTYIPLIRNPKFSNLIKQLYKKIAGKYV